MEMDPLGAMQGERDRFAHENAELRSQIGHLKTQVAGEQKAKEAALKELDTTTKAWKAASRTKDAITSLAPLSPEESDAMMVQISRREEAEQVLQRVLDEKKQLRQFLGDLVARLDRDGGHRQDADATLEATVLRADHEIVRLQALETELKTHDGVLTAMRGYLEDLSDDERVKLFAEIDEGYCPSCGRKLRGQLDYCQCENDE